MKSQTIRREKARAATPREVKVLSMLNRGMLVSEIARALNPPVSRQAMWEFCARRGWLADEDSLRYSQSLLEKDRRRQERRREHGEALMA